jgi:hypothetical protein
MEGQGKTDANFNVRFGSSAQILAEISRLAASRPIAAGQNLAGSPAQNGQLRRSIFREAADCIQFTRIKPYSTAGWAFIYHNRLLRAELPSHHYDIRISRTLQSRRLRNQQAITRYKPFK